MSGNMVMASRLLYHPDILVWQPLKHQHASGSRIVNAKNGLQRDVESVSRFKRRSCTILAPDEDEESSG
jgi:hypothetical protein